MKSTKKSTPSAEVAKTTNTANTTKTAKKAQLPTVTLKDKIKLFIPATFQEQVKYLCSRIWEVEWSGILFYSTKGEFGTKDFEVTAEHILLMNKGSQAYTEFQTDESLVQFLMKNPEYFNMNQGLIHSHNSMGVFFSGTDNEEINENSEFHNYYLSLIVNNKEEMCAKIAFRTKVKENTKKEVKYKDSNGEEKIFHVENNNENEYVYIFDCDIQKEQTINVSEDFILRTDEIIQKELDKNKKKYSYGYSPNNSYGGYNNKADWDYDRSYLAGNSFDKPKQGKLFANEFDKHETSVKPSNYAIEVFLSKFISNDNLVVGSYFDSLKQIQKFLGVSREKADEVDLAMYLDILDTNLISLYLEEFEDEPLTHFDFVLDVMIKKLTSFQPTYWVAKEIIPILELHKDIYTDEPNLKN